MRGGHGGLVRRLRPVLTELTRSSGMSAVLSTPTPTEPIAVDQVDPPGRREPNMVGWALPLHATAAGKLWLAFLDEPERSEVLRQPLARFTDVTLTDPATFCASSSRSGRQGSRSTATSGIPAGPGPPCRSDLTTRSSR